MEESTTIKIADGERLKNLFKALIGTPEDVQTTFDLSFVVMVFAEVYNIEPAELFEVMEMQKPIAKLMAKDPEEKINNDQTQD